MAGVKSKKGLNSKIIGRSAIRIAELSVDVEWKKIRNIRLRVCPPDGSVRISAPVRADPGVLRRFVESKLDWIRKQQTRIRMRKHPSPLEFVTGEYHYYGGKRFILKLEERNAKPGVLLEGDTMRLYIRPDAPAEKRRSVVEEFYRTQLRQALTVLIARWEKVMSVRVNDFGIKKMKTRWGTCNRMAGRIWINLELAKKPPECLEYIVVHEMAHLLERGHNTIFYGYMDRFLPQWRLIKKELNRIPL